MYIFQAKNHTGRLALWDKSYFFSYEYNKKYNIFVLEETGEYRGQMKYFDPEAPNPAVGNQLDKRIHTSLEECTKLYGYWLKPPLEIYNIQKINTQPGKFCRKIWRTCKY